MVNLGAASVACQGNMVEDYVGANCDSKAKRGDSSLHCSDKPGERQFGFLKNNVRESCQKEDRYISRFYE